MFTTCAQHLLRGNAARATGLTLAHLLGHSSTAILPTSAKALDENMRAVIIHWVESTSVLRRQSTNWFADLRR